jgi:hypothetical protein
MKKIIENFYLDYVNNFLTISKMASYYGISEKLCEELINIGRKINNKEI